MKAKDLIYALRRELEPLNRDILDHPYLKEAFLGSLPREKIVKFVVNQLYIIPYDLKSLSHMLSRVMYMDEIEFFKSAVDMDAEAYRRLLRLSGELGVSPNEALNADPEAVAYTHYLAWLSSYASPGEFAVALVVNLPVWGAAVAKLGSALREKYGIKETGLFELFAVDYSGFEEASYTIIERYMDEGAYRRVARFIQHYEKSFWDSIYR